MHEDEYIYINDENDEIVTSFSNNQFIALICVWLGLAGLVVLSFIMSCK